MKSKVGILIVLVLSGWGLFYFYQVDKKSQLNRDLFNYLTSSIFAREAFSPIKNQNLHIDLKRQFKENRKSFLQANTDEDLYFEILKLSNLRRDSHLKMKPTFLESIDKKKLPITFMVVFEGKSPLFIVDQIAHGFADAFPDLRIGDELVQVGDMHFEDFIEVTKQYIPSSTNNNHYYRLAEELSTNAFNLSKVVNLNNPVFTFRSIDHSTHRYTFSYHKKRELTFKELRKYKDFNLVLTADNFNTYVHKEQQILLLEWLDFEEDLPDDVDTLMEWAVHNDKLKHHLIIDATQSSGGINSIYALRRLINKPFKIIKGNLRISDITEKFIDIIDKGALEYKAEYTKRAEIKPLIELVDWLKGQVIDSCKSDAEYSNNVVFKMRYNTHNDSIYRFDTHFDGEIVTLFSPKVGSQIDQMASILKDNQLAYSIGQTTGGFSNTWEWKEPIINPNTGNIVCNFMWNIGHTIRPNGEILEGNPAEVDYYLPPTKDNFLHYKNILVDKSIEYLQTR